MPINLAKLVVACHFAAMPPVTDADYLPNHGACELVRLFYETRMEYLQKRLWLDQSKELLDQLECVDRQRKAWSRAKEATGPQTAYGSKRLALFAIRELLGEKAYYEHNLP